MDNKVVIAYLRGEPATSLLKKAADPKSSVISGLTYRPMEQETKRGFGATFYRDYWFDEASGDELAVIRKEPYLTNCTLLAINVGWRFHGSKIRRMFTFAKSVTENGFASVPTIALKEIIPRALNGENLQPYRVTYLGKVIGLYLPEEIYRTSAILYCWRIYNNSRVTEAEKQEGFLCFDAVPYYVHWNDAFQYLKVVEAFIHIQRKEGRKNFHLGVGLPCNSMDISGLQQTNGAFLPWYNCLHDQFQDKAWWSKILAKYPIENIPDDPDDWMDYLDIKKKAPPAEPTEAGDPSPASPPASASQPEAPAPQARLKHRPPALLNGLDATTLLEEVLTNPLGLYQCEVEGPTALEIKLPPAPKAPTGRTRGPRGAKGKPKLLDLEEAAIRSRIAVMEWRQFKLEVEYRRYAAEHRLERLLGRKLHLDRAYTEHIKPEQLGEVPALVAGLHRPQRDRLCVVCLTYPKPVGKEDAEPIKLAFFPSFWLKDVTDWWVPGLFGTPHDPALLDFCETMPPEWYAALKSVMPPKADNLDIFDIRAL